jgi:hypothetical protein
MARDVKNQAMQQATKAEQQAAAQQAQNQQQLNTLLPAYKGLLSGTGPYATELNNATLEPLSASFDALQNSAALNSARTRNASGYNNLLGQLARTKASDTAQLNAQNKLGMTGMGLQGLSSLYGVNTDLLARELNLPQGYLQIAGNNSQNPFLSALGTGLGTGLGKGLGGAVGAALV